MSASPFSPPPDPRSAIVTAAAASLGDAATPLGKVVRILNNQLQALSQVDARVDDLQQRLSDVQQQQQQQQQPASYF